MEANVAEVEGLFRSTVKNLIQRISKELSEQGSAVGK
jgi:hypothetical protein